MVSKVVLVISSLRMGGAEKMLTLLANHLASSGREVVIMTLESQDAVPAFPLSGVVEVERLGLAGKSDGFLAALVGNFRRIRGLRKAIARRDPEVVISFMEQTNVLCVLACGRRFPVICCERTNPAMFAIGRVWGALRRLVYPFAAAITFQTERAASVLPWACEKAVVIPNPVFVPPDGDCEGCPDGPFVVCLGRLVPEKGFDLFLSAFATARCTRPQWRAMIMGDGPQRKELEALADKLGVRDKVRFAGAVEQVGGPLRRAEIFVLSSRFEGFPSALCEAMACGTAVVSFDCPYGPREIIRDGVDGMLVPPGDAGQLAASLGRLMDDEQGRKAMGSAAENVKDRFPVSAVMGRWEELLTQVVHRVR
jgi:glycosyltransferase involved in cell wall biosynthesis